MELPKKMSNEFMMPQEFEGIEDKRDLPMPGNLDERQREELRSLLNDFKERNDLT